MPEFQTSDNAANCGFVYVGDEWHDRMLCGATATTHPSPSIHLCDEHAPVWQASEDAAARLRERSSP